MHQKTIQKYENLIKKYKKEYLSYKRMLQRRQNKHDHSIEPVEYKNGKKITYRITDINIFQIMDFALRVQNYKLALKNLKWYTLHTPPHPRPLFLQIQAAIIWYKNKKLEESEHVLHFVFKKDPHYRNVFNNEPISGSSHADGSFSYKDSTESQIALERRILDNPDFMDFTLWVRKIFSI